MNDSTAGESRFRRHKPFPRQVAVCPKTLLQCGIPLAYCSDALLIISVIFALVAGEVAVRLLTSRNEKDLNIEMWRYATKVKRTSRNPALSHEHAPGASAHLMGVDVHINSQGLRGKEYAIAKPPGTYRILVLGDSMTFGWGVPVEETYPSRLEVALNAKCTTIGVNVLRCSTQELGITIHHRNSITSRNEGKIGTRISSSSDILLMTPSPHHNPLILRWLTTRSFMCSSRDSKTV